MLKCKDDILSMTEKLVNIQSVVNSSGETEVAEKIYQFISKWDYFQQNPHFLLKEQTIDDEIERYNVMAFVQGTKDKHDQRTLILMGHTDTVGIDDYEHLKHKACFPDQLMEALTNEPIPEQIKEQLDSNEWYFGRGTLDMKAGVASHLYLLDYYAKHPEKLSGNLLFLAECDEEDSSHGMISAVSQLNELKEKYRLEYIGAINADFVTAEFTGDQNRYIYKGTIGKLLPSFYIKGVESHVGSPFAGIDPNYLAAHLTRQISYNSNLCDSALDETTVPPISLKQIDLKEGYTVQTALAAYVYFNFFTFSWTPEEVLSLLKKETRVAMDCALAELEDNYKQYMKTINETYEPLDFELNIYLYEDLYKQAVATYGDRFESHIQQFKTDLLTDETLDVRMYAMRVVEEVCKWIDTEDPLVVLFYSSLYSPHMVLTEEDEHEKNLLHALDIAIDKVQPTYKYPIKQKNFFPHICDMSFLSLDIDLNGINAIENNNPAWGTKHYVNYEAIRELNIPSINIGPYGFDAHSKYERMEKTYSTEIVPNLTKQIINHLLTS